MAGMILPSHKALKGIVHSFVQSLTSELTWYDGDYFIGHIIKAGWRTGATELKSNILTGQIDPSPLLTRPVTETINRYVKNFPSLVTRSQSSIEFIVSAELIITVDPIKKRPNITIKSTESPFTCTLRILDKRGKIYSYTLDDWWIPESEP
jgi:hypothetical protein